jgi:transglutaminase-like putative cysteine protease
MTLEWMRRFAVAGAKDPEVRSAAIQALDQAGASSHDPFAALGAIHRWIQDRIDFLPDPIGKQRIQSPRNTLETGAGNCAQRASLMAAMVRSVRIPAQLRFRVIASNPRLPRAFTHVYVMARVGNKAVALDPTYRETPAGYEYPIRSRVGDFPL